MKTKKLIAYDAKSFIINGKRVFLYGGEIPYFRIIPELWEDALIELKRAGGNCVGIYIPWNLHEPVEGKLNFKGDRNLNCFLELCKKYDFYMIIRPGPYICAEIDFGGLPDWLLSKGCGIRVNDRKYLYYVRKWYQNVFEIIKRHLPCNGGNIVMIQIENELEHLNSDIGYMRRLYDIMKRLVNEEVPLVTNDSPSFRGTKLMDTLDLYVGWKIEVLDKWINDIAVQQSDKPIMAMEFPGGWPTQYGVKPPDVPAEQMDIQLRSALGQKVTAINIYIFRGGTNLGTNVSRGDKVYRGITTSYDFGAPVGEYGNLTKKYYVAKMLGNFLQDFGEKLIESSIQSHIVNIISEESTYVTNRFNVGVDHPIIREQATVEGILANQISTYNETFLLLRNMKSVGKQFKVEYRDSKSWQMIKFPQKGNFVLSPKTAKLLITGIELFSSMGRIRYITSEVLCTKRFNNLIVIIAYGELGEKGEIAVELREQPTLKGRIENRWDGNEKVLYLNYKHMRYDIPILLKASKQGILMIITNSCNASRTWFLGNYPFISNIYFLRRWRIQKNRILLEVEITEEDIYGLVLTFNPPSEIRVNSKLVNFQYDSDTKLLRFNSKVKIPRMKGMCLIDGWKFRREGLHEIRNNFDDSGWKEIGITSLENLNIYDHCYFWYRATFNISNLGKRNNTFLHIRNIWDYLHIYLNGKYIGSYYGADGSVAKKYNVGKLLRKGVNTLAIRLENSPHPKAHICEGAVKKFSGIISPLEITGDGKKLVKLEKFKYRKGNEGVNHGWFMKDFDDSGWEKVLLPHLLETENATKGISWYRKEIKVPLREGVVEPLKLIIEDTFTTAHLYFNGKQLGRYESIGPQRDFYIPSTWLHRTNLLAIAVESINEEKGKLGKVKITPAYTAKKVNIELWNCKLKKAAS